ncbi:myb-like protein I isoform X2 [Lucilia cuprina]|uniref:myb-like protein I isoform X2 n=1 Tax=Lucilia cuprina TaxID=7375 RepID=UPI001F067AFA|nr:myb-like protein I isoform X2 [Lucilia cuprina]
MKVTKSMCHLTIIVLCCLLSVLAETLDTRHLQKQHLKHLAQQQQQQQQQTHHQHNQHSHHHRQHLTKVRQQLLNSPNNAAAVNTRQSRKLDLKSPTTSIASHLENPNSQVELIENVKNIIPKNTTAHGSSTKLRRLSAKDYYNKSIQRRYNARRNAHDDWAYNTYNVHTNTYVPTQTQSHAGKGDDNSDDVEFVSNTGVKSLPDWSRRGYGPAMVPTSGPTRKTTTTSTTTLAPPAMIPARRGYPLAPPTSVGSDSPTTEDPFETNVISRNPSGMDPKDMENNLCSPLSKWGNLYGSRNMFLSGGF